MHLVYKFGVGGMEVGITKLLNALHGSQVHSSICSCRPGDALKERLHRSVRLFELDRQRGNDPALVVNLYRLFRRERPDIVHTHQWGTLCEGLLAATLAGVPFVVHGEHGTLETRRHNALVQRWAWRRVDRVLSVSSRLAERMSQEVGFPLDGIQVIRNGVDLERFTPAHRARARATFAFSPDELVIGCVGRLVPVKDYPTMLRAFARLRESGVGFKALIAGTGPLEHSVKAMASELGLTNVTFLGNRDDVDQILAALDLFVLSSTSEGLSNTIQEAMASGVPVVATRVGGADELVENGATGTLVPSGDVDELSRAMATLARDERMRRRYGQVGRVRAEQLFGLEGMIRGYEEMYLSVATGRSRAIQDPHVSEA